MVMLEVADNLQRMSATWGSWISSGTHGIVMVCLHMIHDTLLRGSIFGRLVGHDDDWLLAPEYGRAICV